MVVIKTGVAGLVVYISGGPEGLWNVFVGPCQPRLLGLPCFKVYRKKK